ncbi:MAG: hypothetical protein LUG59_14260 [Enterocloster clostridioformis]|nr:hypothetical protein [Enterocloster clostridioformis]
MPWLTVWDNVAFGIRKKEQNSENMTLTYVASPLNVPTIIERDQNIFADAFEDMGISLEYAEINSGADQTKALASYLATGGLTVDDVDYVNMSIADAKAALDGGSVDAALIAGAAAYQAKQQGYHMVADGEGLIKAIIAVAVREVRFL